RLVRARSAAVVPVYPRAADHRTGQIALIEACDGKPRLADQSGDVAAEVASPGDTPLNGFKAALPTGHTPAGRQAVLKEGQCPAGTQHPPDLGQRLLRIGDGA